MKYFKDWHQFGFHLMDEARGGPIAILLFSGHDYCAGFKRNSYVIFHLMLAQYQWSVALAQKLRHLDCLE